MNFSKKLTRKINSIMGFLLFIFASSFASNTHAAETMKTYKVMIPGADYFAPFAVTVHPGDSVMWTNSDTDDHTIVSDDAFSTSKYRGVNTLIKGTDSNGGVAGTFKMKFSRPGTFLYYCRFHSMLNAQNQPVAPGPMGGVQDANGNFGTPMMGIVVVIP